MKKVLWECQEAGWWTSDFHHIGVCRERDGKWHSYVFKDDTVKNSPKFTTMKKAMKDAERRAK